MSDGEKSHDATPHRRQQAREEGQVVHSQDLAAAALLLIALFVLLNFGSSVVDFFGYFGREQWSGDPWVRFDQETFQALWWGILGKLGLAIAPFLGAVFVAGILVHLLQVGVLFLPDKLMPDWQRLDPIQGMQRLFSMQSVVTVMLGIFKISIVGTVAYWAFKSHQEQILSLASHDVPAIASFIAQTLLWTCIKVTFALVILALLDYLYQFYKHEQSLKMSPDEVREEMKNLQGDPQVISRRRQVQRQLAQNRLKSDVPKADVVITNPTELAIAVQYDPKEMAAPIVVAKGAGVMAQQIRRVALENNIPIVEKKPLAQSLFKEVEVGHPIPDKMYAAVAEILAYVYQLKGKPLPGAV
jgi:flagellar biosynthesis protein FlhB